ncbi:hypothetical protein CASFOL_013112 [Castilleja foliolosa]|uniref:Cytochrome P450 n=1 Tax=Castilleja foliolosa TaxID=1961234 RepID=A0ABD3DJS8_9LAMI
MEQVSSHPFIFQLLILIPLLLFCFIITKSWLQKPSKNKKLPPSPPKLPILGNLHQLSSSPHKDLQKLAEKYGPIMLLHYGNMPTLIVSSSDGAREIMKTHDLTFADRTDIGVSRRLLYDCKDVSVSPYGEYWRQLKSICVLQLLSNKRVQSFGYIRKQETELLVKKIEKSSRLPVNLSEIFTGYANDVVCRSAFGRKYSEGEKGKSFLGLLREFLELLGTISVGDFVPGLSWINRVNGFDARVDKVAKELDEFLEGVIKERMEIFDQEGVDSEKGENFVDILLDIYLNNSSGVSFDRDSIKAIILDIFAAGTDTTSTVLEWAMAELLRHPKILKRLQNEVRSIAKDDITENDLEKMHYLKAVIKETLRCHTPIPMLVPRKSRNDASVMGYDIPAGTMVMINAWAISRDPGIWVEPEKFNPDRFLNSSVDYKGLDFELIPFGAGRRGCPGIAFAMATNEFMLASLVRRFDWRLPDEVKDLDMSERPGVAIHRDVNLVAIANVYHC